MAVVVIGVIGYLLRKLSVPMAPMVLGVVLGSMMEQNLRRALSITDGNVSIFWSSGVCVTLWLLAAAVVVVKWSQFWNEFAEPIFQMGWFLFAIVAACLLLMLGMLMLWRIVREAVWGE